MATQYFTASSLDGFIAADPEDGLAWLLSRDVDSGGPQGYDDFIAEIGALAMGATTYQWLLTHHPGEWFYDMPTWVFTHRTFGDPIGDVRFTTGPVPDVHAAMTAAAGEKNLWLVGGGELVGQFHDCGFLDEVWIQYAPLTLGSGAPFAPPADRVRTDRAGPEPGVRVSSAAGQAVGRAPSGAQRSTQLDFGCGLLLRQGTRHRERLRADPRCQRPS